MQAGKTVAPASKHVDSSLTFPADTEDAANAMQVCRQLVHADAHDTVRNMESSLLMSFPHILAQPMDWLRI